MDIASKNRILALIVFAIYSIGCVVLGNVANKRKAAGKFGKSFYAGGGNMKLIPLALMLAASSASGGTFLSNPGLANSWGLMWPLCMFTFTTFAVGAAIMASKKLKIVCERLDCVSTGVALKSRYENSSFIGWYVPIAILVFQGLFLYQQVTSGAKLMETVTGLSYNWGLIIFGIVLLGYTLFGGAKGSSVVSIFQGAIMSITAIAITVGLVTYVRGTSGTMANAFQSLAQTDPHILTPIANFGFPMLLSYLFYTGINLTFSNDSVARTTKIGSSKNLHKSALLNMLIVGFWSIVMVTLGTVGKLAFPEVASDSIIPYSALTTLSPLFSGVVVAGVAAAIHSTLAFTLLNINSSVVMDLYQTQIMKGKATDSNLKKVNTISTVVLIVAMTVFAMKPPALIGIINIFSIAGGACAFFVPILFGLWWKRANKYGCIASMILGVGYFIAAQYIKALAFNMNPLVPALVMCVIGMVVVSLLTPAPSEKVIDVWFGVGKSTHCCDECAKA